MLPAEAPVREAAELLTHPHVRNVLVTDGDRLLGSVTGETIVAAVARGADVASAAVGDICDADVPTVAPDLALDEALHVMAEGGLERLPVVEDGRLLGVLPREPVARRLAEDEVE